jgi:hypothetical protein
MGMGFAFGTMAVGTRRVRLGGRVHALDVIGFAAAFVLPAVMFLFTPDIFGILQRALFLIAYAWYGIEALHFVRAREAALALFVGVRV